METPSSRGAPLQILFTYGPALLYLLYLLTHRPAVEAHWRLVEEVAARLRAQELAEALPGQSRLRELKHVHEQLLMPVGRDDVKA